MNWIKVSDHLPPEIVGRNYQVIAASTKPAGGDYVGFCTLTIVQDWVVRLWPKNFVAWYPISEQVPLPATPKQFVVFSEQNDPLDFSP